MEKYGSVYYAFQLMAGDCCLRVSGYMMFLHRDSRITLKANWHRIRSRGRSMSALEYEPLFRRGFSKYVERSARKAISYLQNWKPRKLT